MRFGGLPMTGPSKPPAGFSAPILLVDDEAEFLLITSFTPRTAFSRLESWAGTDPEAATRKERAATAILMRRGYQGGGKGQSGSGAGRAAGEASSLNRL